jgi:hypothetical protein
VAIKLQVYKEYRIVPLRFERAKTGAPDETFPDIDDRGHNFKVPTVDGLAESKEIRGPVVGLRKRQKIKLNLIRESIDLNAPLFLTSSDETAIKIVDPAPGKKLHGVKQTTIEMEGSDFAQAAPKSAQIQVRYQSKDGPIIYELTAYVFTPLPVFLQPHIVTINNNAGTGGVSPSINMDKVMAQVKGLWACCGVNFVVQPTKSWSVNLPTANLMRRGGGGDDRNELLKEWQPNSINIYIVREIQGALGQGISKSTYVGSGLIHPCVFAGERTGAVVRGSGDTYWWANDLAHELGHFFTLWHPTDGSPASGPWVRFETWSMRFLMHNYNYTGRSGPPGDPADWTTFNDFGYGKHSSGNPYRAGMVPLKNVRTGASAGRDAQCSTTRNHILLGPVNLY